MACDIGDSPNYYIQSAILPYEEDFLHEFKGHCYLGKEDIPPNLNAGFNRTRKSVSRNLCGFLNTGKGGTIYCGVNDEGLIMGLRLTQFQKDHYVAGLHDLMSRYTPPVSADRYSIRFVPVFASTTSPEDCEAMLKYDSTKYIDEDYRKQLHLFRTSKPCWCEKDAKAQYDYGIIASDYIIEFKIHPWDPSSPKCEGVGEILNLHQLHADEEGNAYFRRLASLTKLSFHEVGEIAEVAAEKRIQEIQKEYRLLVKQKSCLTPIEEARYKLLEAFFSVQTPELCDLQIATWE